MLWNRCLRMLCSGGIQSLSSGKSGVVVLEQMPKHESLSLSIREPLSPWMLESLSPLMLESLSPWSPEALNPWLFESLAQGVAICFPFSLEIWISILWRIAVMHSVLSSCVCTYTGSGALSIQASQFGKCNCIGSGSLEQEPGCKTLALLRRACTKQCGAASVKWGRRVNRFGTSCYLHLRPMWNWIQHLRLNCLWIC